MLSHQDAGHSPGTQGNPGSCTDTHRRRIVVEDVRMRPDQEQGESDEPAWLRRMVFVSNRSLTQSEAYLQPEEPAPDRAGGAHAGGSPPVRASLSLGGSCRLSLTFSRVPLARPAVLSRCFWGVRDDQQVAVQH